MSKRTRRQFLERSMLAAAATASSPQPAETLANLVNAPGASERLGVAVVGVRGRGNSHLSTFASRNDVEVLYVCDCDTELGQRRVSEVAKRQRRLPRFVSDIRQLLDDQRVDVVTVATPNHWHALAAAWAIQARKDVLLETPVGHTIREGRALVELAQRQRAIVQTGLTSRSNPGIVAAIEYLHQGNIGEVQSARVICHKPRGAIGGQTPCDPPQAVDYNLWLGPAVYSNLHRGQFHYDWHWLWEYGNGEFGNQAAQLVDLARWGLGVECQDHEVFSFGGRFGVEDAGETPNTQTVVHAFGERRIECDIRGLRCRGPRNGQLGVIFEATNGFVALTNNDRAAAFDRQGRQLAQFSGRGNHYENFLYAVRSRNNDLLSANLLTAHRSDTLCHSANISQRVGRLDSMTAIEERLAALTSSEHARDTLSRFRRHLSENGIEEPQVTCGERLTFDVVAETFDNALANELLFREYRSPFTVPGAGL